jgi:dsRNA-specific ribonuclease
MPLNQRDEIGFRNFIAGLLKQANVREDYISKYLSDANMKKFRVAFNHPTFSTQDNYELYEHEGDPIVDDLVTQYIWRKWPQITNVGWRAKLKHIFQSSAILREISTTF